LASSFGAAVLLAIPKLPTSLKAVVFKSPAVDLATAYLHELGASRIQTWAAAQTSSPAHEAIRTATEQNLFGRAHRITAPTLIVHGTKDEVVPSSQAQLLNALMRNSKLHLMEGADHRYTQQGDWEEMLDTSITFLTQFYQPN
jgi:pimeloyl-ACP methyl ester carboxylesterase